PRGLHSFPTRRSSDLFLGRSNVGKSSVLNSLMGSKLAHVSSSPGRTQTINFFAVCWKPRRYTADVMLVDLPGYGYARVSKRVTRSEEHTSELQSPYDL